MIQGHLKQCFTSNAEHECVCDAKYFIKQRDELAWAIAWFLNGGSRERLEQQLKEYEATL